MAGRALAAALGIVFGYCAAVASLILLVVVRLFAGLRVSDETEREDLGFACMARWVQKPEHRAVAAESNAATHWAACGGQAGSAQGWAQTTIRARNSLPEPRTIGVGRSGRRRSAPARQTIIGCRKYQTLRLPTGLGVDCRRGQDRRGCNREHGTYACTLCGWNWPRDHR